MVGKGPWKLIYNMQAPHQLFHLGDDPQELNNAAEHEPDVFREMERELRQLCSPEAENERAHRFEQRQLEALGKGL
jgi:choline-sulfatase